MTTTSTMTRTLAFVGTAVVLGGLAFLTRPAPPEVAFFDDEGELFYPDFQDPLSAASLEVIAYDESSGTATPFKVQLKDGRWSIPSHYDYPADGEEQLAKTASSMLDLRKDKVQTDRLQDHAALGVVDPLDDAAASLQGRGTRITLRDEGGEALCDYIVGAAVEGRQGFRYVRLPEKKRVYAVQLDVDLTTKFADWIETNLLDLTAADATRLMVSDYSIDEQTGSVDVRGQLSFAKEGTAWALAELPEGRELDQAKARGIPTALSQITITGVRPKPASMTADLRTKNNISIDLPTQLSLQSRGFFFTGDGRLLSNEGEVEVGMKDGVVYTLRFGEVLYGEGLEISAGLDDATDGEDGAGDEVAEGDETGPENRYLFVTARFDESLLGERPVAPVPADADAGTDADADTGADADADADTDTGAGADTDTDTDADAAADAARAAYEAELAAWNERVAAGQEKAKRLNDRFAAWYYVISATDFQKIRVDLESVLTAVAASG